MVLCCAFVFTMVSSAQAAHIHGRPSLHRAATAHAPRVSSSAEMDADTDEAHCPFCTAAHFVLPATQTAVVEAVTLLSKPAPVPSDRAPFETWHFARLSRPPPLVSHV